MKRPERIWKVGIVLGMTLILVAGFSFAEEEAPPKLWQATLALGLSLAEGNSKSTSADAALDAARVNEKNEWRTGVSGAYAETEDTATGETQKSTQKAKAYVNYKRKLGELFFYGDSSIFHDELADLDYRLIAGFGGGRYLIDSPGDKVSMEAGAAYIHELLGDGDRRDSIALRIAQRWDRRLTNTSTMWEWIEYLPQTEDFGAYLVNAEVGAQAALDSRLSLRLVVKDTYNSEPPLGRKENDLAVVASLLCKLP